MLTVVNQLQVSTHNSSQLKQLFPAACIDFKNQAGDNLYFSSCEQNPIKSQKPAVNVSPDMYCDVSAFFVP